MAQEYRTAKGWSIFTYIFTPFLIALFVCVGIMPFMIGEFSWWLVVLLVPTSIGMAMFMIYGLLSTYKGKLIIHSDKVIEIGVFKDQQLELSNIKGFRIDRNYAYLIPKNDESKVIKVSHFIENKSTFDQWLYANFLDVDIIEGAREIEEIMANEQFGTTVDEREGKLKRARVVARLLNVMGSLLAALLFFYPRPYGLLTLIALILPVFILASLHFFKGLIRIDQKSNSGFPSIFYGLIFPGMALAFRSYMDFDILEYRNLWLPTIAITIATSLIMISSTSEIKFKKAADYANVVSIVIFVFVYSTGAIINYNCFYDNSQPEHFSSEILNMRISTGKSTTYYVELASWGLATESDEVSISKSLYNQLEIGKSVNIYLMQGKLNIPWFEISRHKGLGIKKEANGLFFVNDLI